MIGGNELTLLLIIVFIVSALPFIVALLARMLWRREEKHKRDKEL